MLGENFQPFRGLDDRLGEFLYTDNYRIIFYDTLDEFFFGDFFTLGEKIHFTPIVFQIL